MTAEEILSKYIYLKDEELFPFPYVRPSSAIKAMEEYTEQEMKRFMNWLFEQPHEFVTRHTSEELIKEYLKQRIV